MDAFIMLVLLTLKGDGPMGVNFVEFRDVPSCEKRAEQLTGVLVKAGYRVVESPCVMGIQHFTPHHHRKTKGNKGKPPAPARKHAYLVALDRQRVLVLPQRDMEACNAERQRLERKTDDAARQRGVRHYCALSEQVLIDDRVFEAMQRRQRRAARERKQRLRKP